MVRDFHWSLSSRWLTVHAVLQVYYVHTNHLPHDTPFPPSVKPTDIHHPLSSLFVWPRNQHPHPFRGSIGCCYCVWVLITFQFFCQKGPTTGRVRQPSLSSSTATKEPSCFVSSFSLFPSSEIEGDMGWVQTELLRDREAPVEMRSDQPRVGRPDSDLALTTLWPHSSQAPVDKQNDRQRKVSQLSLKQICPVNALNSIFFSFWL